MTFSTTDLQNSFGNYPFRSSSSSNLHQHQNQQQKDDIGRQVRVPHQGSLCRIEGEGETTYVLEILLKNENGDRNENESSHELLFHRQDFDFSSRLFSIMDTESRGFINKAIVEEFVTQRCPVFWRRDDDLEDRVIQDASGSKSKSKSGTSPTFEEVWMAVASCSTTITSTSSRTCTSTCTRYATMNSSNAISFNAIGVEGWMVFCRFIALAQYLEAKRRFSGRHLQQTMRHRNAPRGSELVMVNVPPAAPPAELTANELAQYERENRKCLPMPELDLDHSLLAAHDILRRRRRQRKNSNDSVVGDHVKINLFGPPASLLSSNSISKSLEFCLTFTRQCGDDEEITTVRRSMKDMKWLNDTFISHKALGGTLCGRILPPFPGNRMFVAAQKDDSSFTNSGSALAAAANAGVEFAHAGVGIATAGVGILKEGIKSLWGGYASTAEHSSKSYQDKVSLKKSCKIISTMQIYYNPNSPAGKARHLERYLNYLLEHRALSTSFPLNTILKASQSGLEAAKQSLDEHTRAAGEIEDQTPQMDDAKTSTFWSLHGAGSSMQPNLSWVRTAAQAAVALQLHGVLETTGLPSASARLQHASLPSFNSTRNSTWADDDGERITLNDSEDMEENIIEDSFEEGVMHVQDELASNCSTAESDDQGYDLLPLPVPAPERQILNASEVKKNKTYFKETRFRYGSSSLEEGLVIDSSAEDEKQVYIGEMAIDENIDKLREVIGSVDNTLSRCMASSCGIERARRQRSLLHLEILRGLDSWEGLRGKFVSQRAFLKGISGMEQSIEVFEESDLTLIDDISWQTALAHSAVSAAEDVRSTVRAARTAGNAKFAAVSAADMAQSICDNGNFSNVEEARAAETRASISQSHAIHAAVVEHEAKTVKRRATLALAHDVKCWNVHRKREILQICLGFAKSQHEATRRAVDAWSCLRDGFVGSTIIPSSHGRRSAKISRPMVELRNNEPEVEATIFGTNKKSKNGQPTIIAVEHKQLKLPKETSIDSADILDNSASIDVSLVLPIASLIPEERSIEKESVPVDRVLNQHTQLEPFDYRSEHMIAAKSTDSFSHPTIVTQSFLSSEKGINGESISEKEEHEALTSSMQSLVDGLMNWGGIDVEDTFALPTGMAASIALEESIAFGSTNKS